MHSRRKPGPTDRRACRLNGGSRLSPGMRMRNRGSIVRHMTQNIWEIVPMPSNMPHPATLAAQGLGWTDASTGGVVLPLHTATTFERDPDNHYRRGRSYGRADNPGYDQPQALITALEGGAASLLFSSGMAAATAVFRSLGRDVHVVA